MGDYRITLTKSARRELEDLPVHSVRRVFPKIEALSINPRPKGCRKLAGEINLWRIRVGDYRVIYSINDSDHIIDIIAVRHRSDAYR